MVSSTILSEIDDLNDIWTMHSNISRWFL